MKINIATGGRVWFGKEIWRVLDVQGDRALIITENVIRKSKYNAEETPTSWESCTLRKYLNETFFDTFSPNEKSVIVETTLVNSYYNGTPEKDTVDKIFLLSSDELDQYFKSYHWSEAYHYTGSPRGWWLRTLAYPNKALLVLGDGGVYIGINNTYRNGIRPALFLDINKYTILFDKPYMNEYSFAFRRACENGYFAGDDFKRYADAAEHGDINAMFTAAWMAMEHWGYGCKQNAKQSEDFLELAITKSGVPSVEAISPFKSLRTVLSKECYSAFAYLAMNGGAFSVMDIKEGYKNHEILALDTRAVGMNNYVFTFFVGIGKINAARVILTGKKIGSLLTDYKAIFTFDHNIKDGAISRSRECDTLIFELEAEAAGYRPIINKKRLSPKQRNFLEEQRQSFSEFGISLSDSWIYHNPKIDDFKLFYFL